MKKIFSIASIMVLLFSVSFAQEAVLYDEELDYIYDESWDDWDPCGYVLNQLDVVEEISDLFHEHAEEKIIQRLFSTELFQGLVRTMTDELMMDLENAMDVCRDGQDDLYNWRAPMSMSEFERYMQDYVEVVVTLAQLEKQSLDQDMVAEQMLVLQEHLMGELINTLSHNGFMQEESLLTFLLDMKDNQEKSLQVVFDMNTNSISDALGTLGESDMDLTLAVDVNDGEDSMDMTVEATVTMRIVDEHLYIMVSNIVLDVASGDLDAVNLAELDTFLDQVKLVEGKWLDIPLDMGMNGLGMGYGELLALQKGALQQFFATPWLMTYHTEGDTMYAGMHPALCDTGLLGSVTDCLMYTRLSSYEESDGKGFVAFNAYKNSYSLALTDIFTSEAMPPEMAHLNNHEFVSWDANRINIIDIPLGEYGAIHLANGSIDVDVRIPQETYDRDNDTYETVYTTIDLQGYHRNQSLYLGGTILHGDVLDTELAIEVDGGLENMQMTIDFDGFVTIDDDEIEVASSMELSSSQHSVRSLTVKAPDADEVVDFNSFTH